MNPHHSAKWQPKLLACWAALVSLQLAALGATVLDRYSFTTDASDSVGHKDGTLVNATISGGQAVLANAGLQSGDPTGQYVALPPDLVTNLGAITMEAWVTPTLTDGAFWARVWDFGNSDGTSGVRGFIYSRVGDSTQPVLADSYAVANGDSWCFSPALMLNGVENHFVWTADGSTHRARLYLNGVRVGSSDLFTNSPVVVGSTTNDWLGRSQFSGDPYMSGSINEFRIYDGPIGALDVAADYEQGADGFPASYGTVTNIVVQVTTPIVLSASQLAQVLAEASGLTNKAVDIHDEAGVTYTSSNTKVITVDASGNVNGVGVGTANVIATYSGLSSTQSVAVMSLPTTMIHRYSFTTDASDSIGHADGTLQGDAVISNGQAVLDGAKGTWVELPPYLIASSNIPNNAVTFEAWATFDPVNGAWTRLFDFGNVAGNNGANYIFLAPNTVANGGSARLAVSDASPGYNGEDGFDVGNLLGTNKIHVVAVFNPNPSRKFLGLYINGSLVGSTTTTKPFTAINNANSWLGRSTYSGDSWLSGSIDEFRIYNGELDKFQIAASFKSGPDKTNFDIGQFSSFVFDPGAATIPQDEVRQSSVTINFTQAPGINVIGEPTLKLISSDTNVLTINAAGLIASHATGSATLTATYEYASASGTQFYTNAQTITVVLPTSTMVHRYSFNESASDSAAHDSVGSADGILVGGASFTGSQVVLDGTDGYVELPAGIVSVLTNNATFEIWVTDNNSGGWGRFWDFGSAPGLPNIFLTARLPGGVFPRFDWSTGNINSSIPLTNGVPTHFVVLYDQADRSSSMYVDGVLAASGGGAGLALSSISDTQNWLGRSQYADPYLNASIDEFRIYSGLLTAAAIRADFAAGPDQLPVARPTLGASVSGNNLTISWPTSNGSGFTLQSSPTLGAGASWGTVSGVTQVGGQYQAVVTLSGNAQYFRLRQ